MTGLSQTYHALPERGALLDQPVWLLQMHAIISLASGRSAPAVDDPFGGLPMEAL